MVAVADGDTDWLAEALSVAPLADADALRDGDPDPDSVPDPHALADGDAVIDCDTLGVIVPVPH